MRWILKIILFPISLVVSILTAFLTFLLAIGTTILYLLMLMCVVVGIVSLFQKNFAIGIEALIMGFLLSPYGIPMIGAVIISHKINIKNFIKMVMGGDRENYRLFLCEKSRKEELWTLTISITRKPRDLIF